MEGALRCRGLRTKTNHQVKALAVITRSAASLRKEGCQRSQKGCRRLASVTAIDPALPLISFMEKGIPHRRLLIGNSHADT